jgi:hypothetical protein
MRGRIGFLQSSDRAHHGEHSLKRHLNSILSGVSLLIFLTACALCLRTLRFSDILTRTNINGTYGIRSNAGGLEFFHQDDGQTEEMRARQQGELPPSLLESLTEPRWKLSSYRRDRLEWSDWRRGLVLFLRHNMRFAHGEKYASVIFPYWVPAIPFLVLPLLWVRRHLKHNRKGFCPVCGYDLRATPQRCPECGHQPVRPLNDAAQFPPASQIVS